jgi:hypothetical protein
MFHQGHHEGGFVIHVTRQLAIMGEGNESFAKGAAGKPTAGVGANNDQALTGNPIHQQHHPHILEFAVMGTFVGFHRGCTSRPVRKNVSAHHKI